MYHCPLLHPIPQPTGCCVIGEYRASAVKSAGRVVKARKTGKACHGKKQRSMNISEGNSLNRGKREVMVLTGLVGNSARERWLNLKMSRDERVFVGAQTLRCFMYMCSASWHGYIDSRFFGVIRLRLFLDRFTSLGGELWFS